MIMISIGVCIIDIYIGVCIVNEGKERYKNDLSTSYGLQSLGSVIGPALVSIMGVSSLKISGAILFLCFIFYFIKKDPVKM